jgi:hypothetical protein
MLQKLLCHQKFYLRFLALFGLGAILFLFVWTTSYHLLPEGVLRGRTGGNVVGDDAANSLILEVVRLVAFNLFGMVMIIAASRVLKFGCYPLGYIIPLYYSVLYAIILGTNSFAIPLPDKMAPTFEVLTRSGVYEIMAYFLMAAATYRISLYRTERLFPPASEPIEPKPAFAEAIDWLGFGLAIGLLIAANAYEAYMIMNL